MWGSNDCDYFYLHNKIKVKGVSHNNLWSIDNAWTPTTSNTCHTIPIFNAALLTNDKVSQPALLTNSNYINFLQVFLYNIFAQYLWLKSTDKHLRYWYADMQTCSPTSYVSWWYKKHLPLAWESIKYQHSLIDMRQTYLPLAPWNNMEHCHATVLHSAFWPFLNVVWSNKLVCFTVIGMDDSAYHSDKQRLLIFPLETRFGRASLTVRLVLIESCNLDSAMLFSWL